MHVFWYIVLVSIIEYIGDSNFKYYARSENEIYLIGGILAYILMVKILIDILKMTNVIYMNGMWDGISALIETILAIIILRESLNTKYQYIGLGLIIIGIIFLNHGKVPY